MSEPFDPYYCWLGIPPEHQPPHYYRLLGIEPLEPSADVIEAAADRQMAHLRTYQMGVHAELSQDLLNEVAKAKVMLLNPEKKASYDRALRNELALRPQAQSPRKRLPTAQPLSPEPEPPLPRPPISGATSPEVQASFASARSRGQKPPWVVAAAIGASALAVVVLLIVLFSGDDAPPVAQGEGQPQPGVEEPAGVEESAGPPVGPPRVDNPPAPSDTAASTEARPEVPGTEPEVPAAPPAPQEPAESGTGSEPANPPGPPGEAEPGEAEPGEPGESPAAPGRGEGSLADLLEPDAEPSATPGGLPGLGPLEAGPPNVPRDPVPDQAAQQKALLLIREIFKEDYDQAKTPPGKAALAAKMLQQVNQPGTDAVARFVLLRIARDVAAEAGDVETAFWAIDQMAAGYAVDPVPMQVAAWLSAAEAAILPEHRKALAEHAVPLIREAVARDDYATANRLADLATRAAQNLRNAELVRQIVAVDREVERIEKAYEAIRPALATLETNPNDPEANLAAGRFFCLEKDDWARGLVMLARGSDKQLGALAEKELQAPGSPAEQIALGDAWWGAGQVGKENENESLLARAVYWYEHAMPNLAPGLEQARVRKRIEETSGAAAFSLLPGDMESGWRFQGAFGCGVDSRPFLINHPDIPPELAAIFRQGRGRVWGVCRFGTTRINGRIFGWLGKTLVWSAPKPELLHAQFRLHSEHLSHSRKNGPCVHLGIFTPKGWELALLSERVTAADMGFAMAYDSEDGALTLRSLTGNATKTILVPEDSAVLVTLSMVVRHPGEKCDSIITLIR